MDTQFEASQVQKWIPGPTYPFSLWPLLSLILIHILKYFPVSFFSNLVFGDLIAGNDYNYAAYLKGTEDECDENTPVSEKQTL